MYATKMQVSYNSQHFEHKTSHPKQQATGINCMMWQKRRSDSKVWLSSVKFGIRWSNLPPKLDNCYSGDAPSLSLCFPSTFYIIALYIARYYQWTIQRKKYHGDIDRQSNLQVQNDNLFMAIWLQNKTTMRTIKWGNLKSLSCHLQGSHEPKIQSQWRPSNPRVTVGLRHPNTDTSTKQSYYQ